MSEQLKTLSKEDHAFLQEAATNETYENVEAARKSALEATGADNGHQLIPVEGQDGEISHIDVKTIGNVAVQSRTIENNAFSGDNWRINPER